MASSPDVACHINVVVPDLDADRFPRALADLADAGYRRAVLPPLDPATTDVEFLRAAFADAGMTPIPIVGQAPAIGSADPDELAADAASLRAMVDLTVALGGDQLNGVPYGAFGHPDGATSRETFERAAAEIGRAADYAHDHGVTMTFEVLNRYETSVVNTAAQALDFVAASGSDHLRIHLDTFHMAVEEADLAGAVIGALPKLGYLELGQSGRGPLSSGAVDLPALVARVWDAGFRGRFGVEAFSRAVLEPEVAGMLAIWRSPYDDGIELARDAMRLIRDAVSTAATIPTEG